MLAYWRSKRNFSCQVGRTICGVVNVHSCIVFFSTPKKTCSGLLAMDTIFNDVCALVAAACALTLLPGFGQPARSLLARRDQGTVLLIFMILRQRGYQKNNQFQCVHSHISITLLLFVFC